ncbi:MAG: hypothetical protein AB7U35_01750 [Sphingobium sp.]
MSGAISGTGAFGPIGRRGALIADARAERRRRDIAEAARLLPGIDAHVEGEDVVLEGRDLLERWLRDASLREISLNIAGRTAA